MQVLSCIIKAFTVMLVHVYEPDQADQAVICMNPAIPFLLPIGNRGLVQDVSAPGVIVNQLLRHDAFLFNLC